MKSFIDKAKNQPINEEVVKSIEKSYSCNLPEELKHIVSCDDDSRFGYDIKILSEKEIINAEDIIHGELSSYKLIPVIDIFDYDFIAYDIEEQKYVCINTLDEIVFDNADNIYDLLPQEA